MAVVIDGTTGVSAVQAGAVTTSDLPAGTVLQVVSTTKTDVFSTSAAGYVDITGLSVSITPTSITSKIYIVVSISIGQSGSNCLLNLVRNATNIAQSTSGTSNQTLITNQAAAYGMQTLPITFLDSPSTTSATTYKMQMYPSSATMYVNVRATDNYFGGISTITAMEVAV